MELEFTLRNLESKELPEYDISVTNTIRNDNKNWNKDKAMTITSIRPNDSNHSEFNCIIPDLVPIIICNARYCFHLMTPRIVSSNITIVKHGKYIY